MEHAKTRKSVKRSVKATPLPTLHTFVVERRDGIIERLDAHFIDWQHKSAYLALWRVNNTEQLSLVKVFNADEWRSVSPEPVTSEPVNSDR